MPAPSLHFFFFSSRRRHTRSLCDWSSDVCSSDLPQVGVEGGPVEQWRQEQGQDQVRLQLDLGEPRDQGNGQPGQHQQHRLGDSGPAGQPDHHRDGREQTDQQLKSLHLDSREGIVNSSDGNLRSLPSLSERRCILLAGAMRRTFRYRLRPTARQSASLASMLDDHRELYNAALQERRDAWRMRQVSVRYGEQSAQLRDIRRADPDGQGRWSFSSQQATLRRLGRAFDAFFRRVQAGRTPGFPRFKGAGWFDTVEWPSDRDGCRWDSTAGEHRLYLQSVGHIRVHQHREVRGRVKTISVKRDNQRWYVLLSCDDVPPEPLERTGSVVGIDLGVKSFLTT